MAKRQHSASSSDSIFHHFEEHLSLKTDNHKSFYRSLIEGYDSICYGYAGSAKTFISLGYALRKLKQREVEKIIIIRSAVATRDVGFLPGTEEEKMAIFETPYINIVNDLLQRGDGYEVLKKKGMIEFLSSSYLRGLTFDNAIVIVDECQNYTFHEIDTIYTRTGENTQVIFVGDALQMDSGVGKEGSGFNHLVSVASNLEAFSVHNFGVEDIVRSAKVKSWIVATSLLKQH